MYTHKAVENCKPDFQTNKKALIKQLTTFIFCFNQHYLAIIFIELYN